MSAPRIGLPTYGRDEAGRFHLYADYVDAVRRAGGVPLLLPPGEVRLGDWLEVCDAFVLTGGGDLSPAMYGGHGHATNYLRDDVRDATEASLVRALLDEGLPTLAVCRGMQLLNVVLGGGLIEHLPDVVGDACPHRGPEREPVKHPVELETDSLVARVVGTTTPSPLSWHHQAVGRLGRGLRVVGMAPDGTIEAVEHEGHPYLLAVQWHPELSAAREHEEQRLFDALVAEAARRSGGQRVQDRPAWRKDAT